MKKITLSITLLIMSLNISAQSDLKIKSISIFKNGESFVIEKGSVKTDNKLYRLTQTPNALFGTLWFRGLTSKVDQVTSKLDSVTTTKDEQAKTFSQLLYANVGNQLTITTTDGNTYKGIVDNFETDFAIAIIKTDSKWISISPSVIKNIEFGFKPKTIAKLVEKENKPVFDIQFSSGGTQELEMMYLQNGLSWVPTYLLELVSETKAQIRLQAELINDTQDLKNTDINLVVGVPNFKYSSQPATLLSFLSKIEPNYSYTQRNQSVLMGQMLSNASVSYGSSSSQSIGSDNGNDNSDATGDFYFYQIKNLTLPKMGRGTYPLFDNTVNIKHIYECILTDANNSSNNYSSNYSFEPQMADVYHTIEIQNETKTPFTTGSILIIDNQTQRPLAEDMLKYTPINQSSSIKLTTSPDIRVKEQENITRTQEAEKKANGYTYNLLTIESEVTITNSKKEDVAMMIKKVLDGKIQKASIKYTDSQKPNSDRYVINPVDNLEFKIDIKAGQTYKFSYTYQKYMRM